MLTMDQQADLLAVLGGFGGLTASLLALGEWHPGSGVRFVGGLVAFGLVAHVAIRHRVRLEDVGDAEGSA